MCKILQSAVNGQCFSFTYKEDWRYTGYGIARKLSTRLKVYWMRILVSNTNMFQLTLVCRKLWYGDNWEDKLDEEISDSHWRCLRICKSCSCSPLIIALQMAVKLRMKYEIRSSLITTVTNALSLSSTHSLDSLKDVKWMPGVQKSNCLQRICKYPSVWSQLLWWLLRKQVRSNQLKSTD